MMEGDRQVLFKYDVFTTKARGTIKNVFAQNSTLLLNPISLAPPRTSRRPTSLPALTPPLLWLGQSRTQPSARVVIPAPQRQTRARARVCHRGPEVTQLQWAAGRVDLSARRNLASMAS